MGAAAGGVWVLKAQVFQLRTFLTKSIPNTLMCVRLAGGVVVERYNVVGSQNMVREQGSKVSGQRDHEQC